MSTPRRSTRLATKANQDDKNSGNDRSRMKRRRGPSGAAIEDDDVNNPSSGTNNDEGAVGALLALNGSAAFSPLSIENDSFLLALDKIESGEKSVPVVTEYVDSQCETICDNSPDVFGDDKDILEALPPTPAQVQVEDTPKRSLKRPVPSKRLSVEDNSTNIVQKPGLEDVQTEYQYQSAKEIHIQEKSVDAAKEQRPQRGKKRTTTTGGEKKKNMQGKGTKEKKQKKSRFKLAFTNRKAIKELANSASNELSKTDLSFMTTEEKLQLASWGLPPSVLKNYQAKGINSLFPWQLKCLANEKVLEGRNLLYSAPTSAGKTLVSEILMVKRVLELGRKAIMILPFVSVAREKVYSLQSIFGDAGIRVEGFMGSVNPPGGFKAVDIAICTIEKANSLVNKLLEENSLADLGTLVVDELHLIGDPNRGYLLELLLTKILYMTSIKNQNPENSLDISDGATWRPKRYHIQVIGMSATLPNLHVLADWLKAELYTTDFRPVPLKERLKIEDKLYDEKMEPIRNVKTEDIPVKLDGDTDNIGYLALETVIAGYSVLIFCPTKIMVEQIAKRISDSFYKIGNPNAKLETGKKLREFLDGSRIMTVMKQLEQCPGGVDEVLKNTIRFGVGFHHAGLTYENRDIVESAFKRGILRVIVATSTLSAGVNLPARRVMIVTPMFNGSLLDTMTYRQMCGRAGRNGIDTEGESILICPDMFKEKGMQLFKGQMPLVKSALMGDGSLTSSMKRALLEAIASGIASLSSDVRSYARCTFLFHSIENGLFSRDELSLSQANKDSTVEKCMEFLESNDFIRKKQFEEEDKPDEYMPTNLGSACLAASLSPDDGIIVYKELVKARECFVLENELHVIYQVTPIYVSHQLNNIYWKDYLKIWENLDASEKKVATLVGVSESFIIRAMIGSASRVNPKQMEEMAIHQRFFAALALSDLVNEKSLEYVGNKFSLNKGVLQNLQQAASTFAGMVTAFCGRLGWSNLELLLSQFQERLEFGVQRELCDLVRLDCLNGQRARILYDAGLKSIVELAAADPAHIEQVLHKATPFKSDVLGRKESSIWMIGKDTLTETEAAQKIVQDARHFIQVELGHQGNIQFAFGSNDVPTFKGNKKLDDISSTSSRMTMNKNSNGNNVREGCINGNTVDSSVKTSNMGLNNSLEEASEGMEVNEKNNSMNEIFSQRNQQREMSLSPVIFNNEDVFEDSFPELRATNISEFYNKGSEMVNAGSSNNDGVKKFSIEQEVEKIRIVNPPMSRMQCDSYKPRAELQHSTPLRDSDTKRQRFTLKQTPNPVCSVSSVKNVLHTNMLETNCEELSHGILAELDKDFSTFGELVESPRNNSEVNKANIAKPDAVKSESLRLNDSVAAAMQALADDSNFDSEELFPEPEVDEDRNNNPEESVPDRYSLPENGRSNVVEDEDFIVTQASFDSEVVAEKDENEFFEESSSDAESSSMWANNSIFNPRDSPPSVENIGIDIHELTVGKANLTVKIVTSADIIPSDFFSRSEMVGMGMKLLSQKKSVSIARQGIGAKVIGTGTGNAGGAPQIERMHSVAVFNGVDIIWVLRWEDSKNAGDKTEADKKNFQLDKFLRKINTTNCAIAIFESKEKIKSLLRQFGASVLRILPPGERIWDPRIAQWMWEFDDDDWNVSKSKLIDEYVNTEEKSISCLDLGKEIIEAYFVWKVMIALKEKLMSTGLWNHFITTEMPSTMPLVLMELNGLGLDTNKLGKLKRILQFKSALLELRSFQLAGRQFNLNSPKDIKQILYREIGLKQLKGKGTGKDVLLKLDHELPGIIVEWRKVSNALQKVVIPFQQERNLETGRVHGHYSHFTVTGRVVMSDPSLQCIPRDFDIPIAYDPTEISEIINNCKIKFGSKLSALLQQLDTSAVDMYILNNTNNISMRNAFVPCREDFVILAADYSQLELRILAHISGDFKLLEALNGDTDVFTEIAAEWKKLPKSKITNAIRQEAKGIVYGVIYGMSSRTLAEQMEIEEREAMHFITQFMRTYPGISSFIEKTYKLAQENGYVETMTGRRRYLPLINSRHQHDKAKAKRQAVNTQIQGSAADLVKTAMTRIHAILRSTYPIGALPVDWNKSLNGRRSSSTSPVKKNDTVDELIFFPILNLHDELIFEVKKTHLQNVAKIIKHEMESCCKLHVQLPVVIKTGDSWGTMKQWSF